MPISDNPNDGILAKIGVTMTPAQIREATLEEERLSTRARAGAAAMELRHAQLHGQQAAAPSARKSAPAPTKPSELQRHYILATRAALFAGGEKEWVNAFSEMAESCMEEPNPLGAAVHRLLSLSAQVDLLSLPPKAARMLRSRMEAEEQLCARPSDWGLPRREGDEAFNWKAREAWRAIEILAGRHAKGDGSADA